MYNGGSDLRQHVEVCLLTFCVSSIWPILCYVLKFVLHNILKLVVVDSDHGYCENQIDAHVGDAQSDAHVPRSTDLFIHVFNMHCADSRQGAKDLCFWQGCHCMNVAGVGSNNWAQALYIWRSWSTCLLSLSSSQGKHTGRTCDLKVSPPAHALVFASI
jgi:hypothetical protein